MKTYHGSCHCQAVQFEIESDLSQVISCNCSNCAMRALLLSFVPAGQFKLIQGAEFLKTYLFNKKVIEHQFCTQCGVETFGKGKNPADGTEVVAVNLRCLQDLDLSQLKPVEYNGRDY